MKKHFVLLFVFVFCLTSRNVVGETTENFLPASIPALVSAVRIEGPVNFLSPSDEIAKALTGTI